VARSVASDGEHHAGAPVVYGLERYRRRPTGDEITARVGMAVFLGSWAMLFIALFFAYAFVRSGAPEWPPLDAPPLPRLLPGLNTLVVAGASFMVVQAVRARDLNRMRATARALAVAAGLGAVFLVLQVVVWTGLWRAGLVPSGGTYPSVFYAFTVFHALHVLVGLFAVSWLALRARRGAATRIGVRLWGWYWHFVGALWIALYLTVYLA
jgi:heme/copper-type cytochrome/quinol oxidase subunit 3